MTTLPDQYFSLFQQQIDACQISDKNRHAEIRRGLNRKIKQCISELKKLSDQDNPEIWFALGHAATFFDKDVTEATAWYQKAADAGHTQAITKMGNRLRQSKLPEDQEKSQQWLGKAAEQGDSYAMLCLGFAYRDGKGVPLDLKLARHWFELSRAAGDPSAIEHLADLLFKHQHSPAQALPLYLEAQTQGIACDQELAEIYNTRGSGVYDPTKAKEYYETLLRRGKKSAPWVMLELAKLHASGQVSDNGLTHARKWCFQIISQCPKTLSARKKAERLLKKLDEHSSESLF